MDLYCGNNIALQKKNKIIKLSALTGLKQKSVFKPFFPTQKLILSSCTSRLIFFIQTTNTTKIA